MALPNAPIIKVYYGKPILPEVSRVLACLYEKDFEMVGYQNVQNLPVDLIRLQASTSVPAPFFEDGPKFLFESRAICRYISETYADRGTRYLLGRDLLDRVSIEQWLKSEEQSFDPPSRALVLHLAFPQSSISYNLLEESERLAKVLDVYNHRLGDSRYLAGEEFTLADLTHLPNSQYIATSEEWGHLFYERENVMRWWDEVSTRPSWSKVVDDIERSEEEEEEEEETRLIEIMGSPPKMSLNASIFQPIETIGLPGNTTSTITVSKNVASPRGSTQVSVPDKRGFLVSVPDTNVARIETTKLHSQATPHSKEQVTDAKVTMEESYIPPTGKQIPPTDRIDKVHTEPTIIGSQSTKPVTDAKVTIEGSAIPSSSTQVPSTDCTDKASTKPTGVVPQNTKKFTDATVTWEKKPPPQTSREVPPTPETTAHSAKVIEKYTASPTDETSARKSRGLLSKQEPPPTTKTGQPTKSSLEGTQTTPAEKTTTKPLSKEQGQTFSPTGTTIPPAHDFTESPEVHKKDPASPTYDTNMNEYNTQAPLSTNKTVHPTKPSLEGPDTLLTEKTTTKPLTRDQGKQLTTETKRGETGEELTNKKNKIETDVDTYLAAKHEEWNEQWRKPEKFGEQKHTDSIPVQKPKPPKIEDTTPTPTKSSDMTRQDPVTSMPIDAQVKEPSESRTSTKSKDTTPTSMQDPSHGKTNNILEQFVKQPKQEGTIAATTQTPAAKTTPRTVSTESTTDKSMTGSAKETSESTVPVPEEESSHERTNSKPQERASAADTTQKTTDSAAMQLPPPSSNGTAGGIANKTKNVLAKSPTANIPTATAEPKPNTLSSSETKKPTVPATEESSQASKRDIIYTTEPKVMWPVDTEIKTSRKDQTPSATTQITPTNETAAGTTDVSQSKGVPDVIKEALAGTKSVNDSAQNSQADKQKAPLFPATEDTSRGSNTDKQKEMPNLAPEKKTTRKGQIPTTDEAAAGTTDISQKVPTELKEASAGTKSGNDLAQNSRADTQKRPPVPATEDISRDSTTNKPMEMPELATETETKRKGQTPPTKEAATGTTDVSQMVPTEFKEASSGTKSGNGLAQNSQADTQKRPPVPAIEDVSQGSRTGEPKEMPKLDAETKTTRKGQAPPIEEAARTTDVSQSTKTPTEPKEASPGTTKSGNNLAQNSEADAQKTPPVDIATPKSQISPLAQKQYSVDEVGTEKIKDEISSRQSPSSTNQEGGELSSDEKSSPKKTDAASDGSRTTLDTTPKQQETQNETEMGTKTETDKLDTNEPDQTPLQPNKTDGIIPKNETLTETKQNMSLPQDKEPTSSNASPPKVRNEQNEPDSTDNPGSANKE